MASLDDLLRVRQLLQQAAQGKDAGVQNAIYSINLDFNDLRSALEQGNEGLARTFMDGIASKINALAPDIMSVPDKKHLISQMVDSSNAYLYEKSGASKRDEEAKKAQVEAQAALARQAEADAQAKVIEQEKAAKFNEYTQALGRPVLPDDLKNPEFLEKFGAPSQDLINAANINLEKKTLSDLEAQRASIQQQIEEAKNNPGIQTDASTLYKMYEEKSKLDQQIAANKQRESLEKRREEEGRENKAKEDALKKWDAEFEALRKKFPDASAAQLFQYEGKPLYYSKIAEDLLRRAQSKLSSMESAPVYPGQRIAQPTPEELTAFDAQTQKLLKPDYDEVYRQAMKKLQELQNSVPTEDLIAAKEAAGKKLTNQELQDQGYVNEKNLDSLAKRMHEERKRRFETEVIPSVHGKFINGSWNTGARLKQQERALREFAEAEANAEQELLSREYDKARDTASRDKQMQLNFLLSKAGLQNDEIARKAQLSSQLSNMSDILNKNRLLDLEALNRLGATKREAEQSQLNQKYEDWAAQKNFDLNNIQRLNAILNNMPAPDVVKSVNTATPQREPGPSPWQAGVSLGGDLLGLGLANKKAQGGMIQHKARGGRLTDDMLDDLRGQYLESLKERQAASAPNPWLSYLSSLGSNLGRSQNPNFMQSLAGASGMAAQQVKQDQAANEATRQEAQNDMLRYAEGLARQEEARELADRDFQLARDYKMGQLGIARDQLEDNRRHHQAMQDAAMMSAASKMSAMPRLTPAEIRINKIKLKELASDARTAQREERILADMKKVFKQLDKHTNWINESGSRVSKIASKAPEEYGFENLAYNRKAQAALQEISKLNSQLYQNRVIGAGARATNPFKEEVKKGLPRAELLPEARNEILLTKTRENYDAILRSKFQSLWSKETGGSLDGAEDAFLEFSTQAPLLNTDGTPNRTLLKQLPNIVKSAIYENYNGYSLPQSSTENIEQEDPAMEALDEEEDILGDLASRVSHDQIEAAIKRKESRNAR